jgi:CubicO group peptidase (beta-lactamase class C family)
VTPNAILNFNKPENREVGVPGGGGIATAGQLALFYQPLINRGETATGRRVMKPETIEFATQVRTLGRYTDPMTGLPVSRGLSMIVANSDGFACARGFGHNASPRAFGHGGAGGQVAWGDPQTGISVGYCTNGFVGAEDQGRRTVSISSLAGACARD